MLTAKAFTDPESFSKAAERTWNLLTTIIRSARRSWQSQHYEVLLKNNMEMHEGNEPVRIETQSRWLKRKRVWRTQFDGRRLWVQVEEFWQLPRGRRLYICQTEKIDGRRRVLFKITSQNRPLFIWAERVISRA
jgi:hypothetical protein